MKQPQLRESSQLYHESYETSLHLLIQYYPLISIPPGQRYTLTNEVKTDETNKILLNSATLTLNCN